MTKPKFLRYLSNCNVDKQQALDAARKYVSLGNQEETSYLYRKPFSESSHAAFYSEMYQVLNLIQVMELKSGAAVLEVGSGPGWVTEILALLGYAVHALDPSQDMHDISKQRFLGLAAHYKLQSPPKILYHSCALEDGLDLPDFTFDGTLFHASLHHIVNELVGLKECFRLLKPGGVLAISEWAWKPGDINLETQLDAAMARFGTLENPFTQEYIEWILKAVGFVHIVRYHGINGFFPDISGDRKLRDIAQSPASSTNNLTCIRPFSIQSTADKNVLLDTKAELKVLSSFISADRSSITINLLAKNIGKTMWVSRGFGKVRLSFFSGELGSNSFKEAGRFDLPSNVSPGEETKLTANFCFEAGKARGEWFVGLLAEGNFWFDCGSAKPIDYVKLYRT